MLSHPPVREKAIEGCGGKDNFLGVYSAISIGTFLPMCFFYRKMIQIPNVERVLPSNILTRSLGIASNSIGALTITQSILNQSPSGMPSNPTVEKIEEQIATAKEPNGILRITRHPLFTALGFFGKDIQPRQL